MGKESKRGFDYESLDDEYAVSRRTDPVIARQIHAALGAARSVLNVGAGTGSYEPEDRHVVAVEPSRTMRSKRPPSAVPAIACTADELPFDPGSFDASMAVLTVHHWPNLKRGLAELRRVTRGPVLVVSFDAGADTEFWMADYAPEMTAVEERRYGPIARIVDGLGGQAEVLPVAVPRDCVDWFQAALYARPELFLRKPVRDAQSAWSHLPDGVEARVVHALADDLESGAWDERYGVLRSQPRIRCQMRLVIARS
ncbi:MAG: methyltransferase domain-containing protein [bacterium]|nr:methyltransferase domain-containing protein [bacterium]